ncbi:HNH endonuclease [Corynebacterium sp. CCUG 71335]|uniref:HNH endonuclease signature motif containing protein n=1 Tax=Corynebacterium sp. CCUG 71335 TaxID=2823892 RepID=UPI00210ABB05|nr:HNH endonuclease signature motif containing protein [Corynebacterium sp. CCUG 71335]MCQ4620608.1 HNH endonuclease [Corynebacterium sp. CCUG 71335]
MNAFGEAVGAMSQGIDFLAGFDRNVALDAGFPPHQVRTWAKAREVYFGKTRWSRKQAVAVDKARGVPLAQLVLIEERIRHIGDEGERWRLRHELLGLRGNYDSVKRKAAAIVPPKEKKPPKPGIRFGASVDGVRSVSITGPERELADLEKAVSVGLDPERPGSPQKLEKFLDLLRDDGPRVPRSVPRPIVMVPVDEAVKILGGEGDDTVLGLTDGTTMTASELVAEHFGDQLEVAVFHPQEGAVNLLRGQRFANAKQRTLVSMVQPICAVPGCRHAADMCEMHHITPWKHGGQTNLANLAPLCRYHNRTNDDDDQARRGRIENIRGAPMWVSPRGYPMPNNRHPYGALRSLFGT